MAFRDYFKSYREDELLASWASKGFAPLRDMSPQAKALIDRDLSRINAHPSEKYMELGVAFLELRDVFRPYSRLLDYTPHKDGLVHTYFSLVLDHETGELAFIERVEHYGSLFRNRSISLVRVEMLGSHLPTALERADELTAEHMEHFFSTPQGEGREYKTFPYPLHGTTTIHDHEATPFQSHREGIIARLASGLEAMETRDRLKRKLDLQEQKLAASGWL